MFKISITIASVLTSIALVMMWGSCQKVEHGYLSDRVFYQVNPFNISQGVTAVSAALVTDGSTSPLRVQVLALRDSLGHDADSILTTPRSIVTFKDTPTPQDSTLAQLQAKLKDSLVSPFNIAEIGGRLQFTAATSFVPYGTYNLDLAVSNVRGTKVIQNACEIVIRPLENTYNLLYKRLRYWDNGTGDGGANREDQSNITVKVKFTSGTPESKVIYKYVDKNNKPFNPNKGEIVRFRVDWPAFQDWDPYYKPVYTDSTLEFQIPNIGLSFPYYPKLVLGSMTWSDAYTALIYYKVPASVIKSNQLVQILTSMQFLTAGTYVVTIRIPDVEHV